MRVRRRLDELLSFDRDLRRDLSRLRERDLFDRFPSLESLLGDLFWRFLESLSPLEISVISKISSSSAAGRGRLERDEFSL